MKVWKHSSRGIINNGDSENDPEIFIISRRLFFYKVHCFYEIFIFEIQPAVISYLMSNCN